MTLGNGSHRTTALFPWTGIPSDQATRGARQSGSRRGTRPLPSLLGKGCIRQWGNVDCPCSAHRPPPLLHTRSPSSCVRCNPRPQWVRVAHRTRRRGPAGVLRTGIPVLFCVSGVVPVISGLTCARWYMWYVFCHTGRENRYTSGNPAQSGLSRSSVQAGVDSPASAPGRGLGTGARGNSSELWSRDAGPSEHSLPGNRARTTGPTRRTRRPWTSPGPHT